MLEILSRACLKNALGSQKYYICESAKSDTEIKIDNRTFQYCKRLETVNIGNGKIEEGFYVFGQKRLTIFRNVVLYY